MRINGIPVSQIRKVGLSLGLFSKTGRFHGSVILRCAYDSESEADRALQLLRGKRQLQGGTGLLVVRKVRKEASLLDAQATVSEAPHHYREMRGAVEQEHQKSVLACQYLVMG